MDIASEESSEQKNDYLMKFDIEEAETKEQLYDKIIEKKTFSKNRIKIIICMVFIFIADGMEMTIFNFIIKPFDEYFNLSCCKFGITPKPITLVTICPMP